MSAKVNSSQLIEVVCKIANTTFDLREKGEIDFLYPVLIEGEKGVGKTELIKTLAKKISDDRNEKVKTTFLYLSTQDTADLIGMPDKVDGKTSYLPPDWFPDEEDMCHIVVLDEVNRAPLYVQQTMLPFAISGLLHTQTLPKKSIVICLQNPPTEDYIVNNMSDAALLDRFSRLNYSPSLDEWLDHAESTGVADCVISCAKKMKSKMIVQDWCKETSEVSPSNRTFTRLGILINSIDPKWIEKYGDTLSTSYVGKEFAIAIMKQQKNILDKTLSAEDILLRFPKNEEWLKNQGTKENYESGKFNEMNLNLKRYITNNFHEIMKNKDIAIKNLCSYLNIMGDDQLLEFAKGLKNEMSRGDDSLSALQQAQLMEAIDDAGANIYHRIKGIKIETEEQAS